MLVYPRATAPDLTITFTPAPAHYLPTNHHPDFLLSRLVTVFTPNWVPQAASSADNTEDGAAALAALKTKLRWRDDVTRAACVVAAIRSYFVTCLLCVAYASRNR